MEAIFVTSNKGKFAELQEQAKSFNISLSQVELDIPEIRGNLKEIAIDKCKQAYEATNKPVMVDDSGFFVRKLQWFPGAFSVFVLKTLGNKGILKLMEGEKDRYAKFQTCAVYFDGVQMKTFEAECPGTIIEGRQGRGENGFGYDPIFIPEGHSKTFAEDVKYKLQISHRKKAFDQLFKFLSVENRE
ncbi:MAG: RdgB/HAM1 family non-canonical purine NTP pyrophosphatase [Candidatus Altiarchaeota archaeon]|nr:RdgB/HAM1 family non-canonical purine NTP pyrophosphatase [Candidatus Altiarchaeota archaeon]